MAQKLTIREYLERPRPSLDDVIKWRKNTDGNAGLSYDEQQAQEQYRLEMAKHREKYLGTSAKDREAMDKLEKSNVYGSSKRKHKKDKSKKRDRSSKKKDKDRRSMKKRRYSDTESDSESSDESTDSEGDSDSKRRSKSSRRSKKDKKERRREREKDRDQRKRRKEKGKEKDDAPMPRVSSEGAGPVRLSSFFNAENSDTDSE